jgi:hypothetical protein
MLVEHVLQLFQPLQALLVLLDLLVLQLLDLLFGRRELGVDPLRQVFC